mmetsp:Transcript_38845/g.37183  ORF Transcript_38845/g.37183 Transcript_38845/m.37183 type:complete len:92 (+) Transcript_38845:75-350(+)|eukprot:CAMPEP_0170547032 /NCGR_PEP_ID=MMETSP0211-20121228/5392_1 /TAXON_ID=311385 /ORGANISM="Pseudokeronopsis sp., Strain OXSARD2" /LENGTH=91 /DNA_ID=CAMNT_0010851817 /DNA_START=360 /DNA_END=635 /DNA_ORIENTATION=+
MNELDADYDTKKMYEKEKNKYEVELHMWKNQCITLEKVIQQEKYQMQISQAEMQRDIELEYKKSLQKYKAQAQQDAERNIQDIERNIHYEN